MKRLRRAVPTMLVSVVILTGVVVTTLKVEQYNHRPYLYTNLYLPSGKFLGTISMGYKQIVADVVWMSAVQYYGGYRKDYHNLAYFEGLIEIVNDLDPHFIFPYVFAALVLSQDMRQFDRGIDILKRGMGRNPRSWRLPFEIGFLHYIDRNDAAEAARYFDLSSRIPGSPDRAKRFAAFIYSDAGHVETSIQMWETLKETTDVPYMREMADRYIEKLKQGKSLRSYAN